MDLRPITETYSVAPQLEPSDMPALAQAGVSTVICNRPDAENPPALQAAQMQAAAEAAGIAFVFNPIIGGGMTMDNVEEQADAIAGADGPVVAYCASGNRSSIVWALTRAGRMPTDEILAATRAAGYNLDGVRPQIEALAEQSKG
ncbi:TIGR01244 family sulfur transferase [Rhodophyticola porphyridii]|uniref:TIGR01244 family phosphatase n=1 Tax=Rhodophyticola porphyridii TaxID=1852017 RepID=A0A3L9YKN1_9RHOB|nr:TIGR01244 family sulfur transferase [Rhodophyticola porphyridii]RMA43370.1 TIGR01244 family phosphatase [Rhodophyticola porphyridii]